MIQLIKNSSYHRKQYQCEIQREQRFEKKYHSQDNR